MIYVCELCGYEYNPKIGDPENGIAEGTDFEDLMQIGTIGLVKAIRSFDRERGTCFSTYAVPLIIGEIRRHLRDEGPIKVSRIYKRQGLILMCEKNRIAAEEGMGVDCVSGGELYTALKAGFPAELICFHGNNKTDADIEYGITSGVGYFVA